MVDEYEKTASALSRVKKTSRFMQILLKTLFIGFFVIWGFLIIAIVASAVFFDSNSGTLIANISSFPFVLVHGIITLSLIKILLDIFSDVVRGDSPFTLKQSKRLKIVALLFLASALFEAISSIGLTPVVQAGQIDVNYVDSSSGSGVSINVGNLFCSFIFLALSIVFKYGVLLQEFTDETL